MLWELHREPCCLPFPDLEADPAQRCPQWRYGAVQHLLGLRRWQNISTEHTVGSSFLCNCINEAASLMPVPAEPVPGTTLQLVFASNFRIKRRIPVLDTCRLCSPGLNVALRKQAPCPQMCSVPSLQLEGRWGPTDPAWRCSRSGVCNAAAD